MDDAARDANVAIVRKFLDALDASDLDTMYELLAADGFVFEMPYVPESLGRRIDGRDAFIQFEREIPQLFGPEHVHDLKADTLASDPNEVLAEPAATTRIGVSVASPSATARSRGSSSTSTRYKSSSLSAAKSKPRRCRLDGDRRR